MHIVYIYFARIEITSFELGNGNGGTFQGKLSSVPGAIYKIEIKFSRGYV